MIDKLLLFISILLVAVSIFVLSQEHKLLCYSIAYLLLLIAYVIKYDKE